MKNDNAKKIERAYDYVVRRLKAEGCTLMVYKAMTTNSIYVKVDDGVAGSLRISDHKGKKHLGYTYNLVMGSERKLGIHMGNKRWYAPLRDIEILVDVIIHNRKAKLQRFGKKYAEFMQTNRERGSEQKGFWKSARYI